MSASGYTPISLYYSTTASATPLAANLTNGELAINITDGKLYYKDNGGTVQLLASKAGSSGDVVGPASATDKAIATYDGTTGKLIQNNSGVTITAGVITATGFSGPLNGTVGATTPTTGAFTTLTASADSTFSSTGALLISKGTTGQQPGVPVTGMLRYNTTTNQFEGYSGSSPAWNPVGGASLSNDTSTSSNVYPLFASATSGSATTIYTSNAKLLYKPSTGEFQASVPVASNGIFVNNATVGTSYTIASGYNGQSVGPVTISSGVAITVSSNQRWLIL